MRILAVDDEKLALEGLLDTIRDVAPSARVAGFRCAEQALAYAKEHRMDVAFLDIEMRDMNGKVLAQKLQEINPQMNVIFTTGYSDYMQDAFALHASGYLMKPVTEKKVREEMEYLRYPVEQEPDQMTEEALNQAADQTAGTEPAAEKLIVRTFGNFEVYYKGLPLHFKYQKTKELLAYLIDRRGALCGLEEISAILWEDDSGQNHVSYLKNLRRDLAEALDACENRHVLVRRRGQIGIIPSKIECDYYSCIDSGDMTEYTGEYMSQYSWGEFTHGMLDQRSKYSS